MSLKKRLNKKALKIIEKELNTLTPEQHELFFNFTNGKFYWVGKCRKTVVSLRDSNAFKLYCRLHGDKGFKQRR